MSCHLKILPWVDRDKRVFVLYLFSARRLEYGSTQPEALMDSMCERYRRASRKSKTLILDEVCAATGFHRKYAIGRINLIETCLPPKTVVHRKRKRLCGREVFTVVETGVPTPSLRSDQARDPVAPPDPDQVRALGCRESRTPGTRHLLPLWRERRGVIRLFVQPDRYRLHLGRDQGRPGERRGGHPRGVLRDERGPALRSSGHRFGQRTTAASSSTIISTVLCLGKIFRRQDDTLYGKLLKWLDREMSPRR
jgi:hypothetical protein